MFPPRWARDSQPHNHPSTSSGHGLGYQGTASDIRARPRISGHGSFRAQGLGKSRAKGSLVHITVLSDRHHRHITHSYLRQAQIPDVADMQEVRISVSSLISLILSITAT